MDFSLILTIAIPGICFLTVFVLRVIDRILNPSTLATFALYGFKDEFTRTKLRKVKCNYCDSSELYLVRLNGINNVYCAKCEEFEDFDDYADELCKKLNCLKLRENDPRKWKLFLVNIESKYLFQRSMYKFDELPEISTNPQNPHTELYKALYKCSNNE